MAIYEPAPPGCRPYRRRAMIAAHEAPRDPHPGAHRGPARHGAEHRAQASETSRPCERGIV